MTISKIILIKVIFSESTDELGICSKGALYTDSRKFNKERP